MAKYTHPSDVARQWASRPQDQRYATLDDLLAEARSDRESCGKKTKRTEELRIVADGSALTVQAGARPADFTPWSFAQFNAIIGAPSRYLAGLPAALAAECMNHGLETLADEPRRQEHQILIRQYPDDPGRLTLRAITSPSYARVWDAPLIETIQRFEQSGAAGNGRTWQTPPSWPGTGTPGGLYRSDRDLYILQVDGGSIVTDPTLVGSWSRTPGAGGNAAGMSRGFILRNSEVGGSSLEVVEFYFRWICGNHGIGGLGQVKNYKRRHVGTGLQYIAEDALGHIARWLDTPASRDEQIIRQLAEKEIGTTKEDTIAELRGRHGLTESQATRAYTLAEENEQNPRSVWGITNGITRMSQEGALHNDARFSIDRLAAQITAKYARQLVAA